MPDTPVPPGAVRMTLTGEPTAEQTLKAATAMLKMLRAIERNMRATGAIPPGPRIKWKIDVRSDDN